MIGFTNKIYGQKFWPQKLIFQGFKLKPWKLYNKLEVENFDFELLKGSGLEYEKSTNWKVELVPVDTIISYSTIIITSLFGMSIRKKLCIFLGKKYWLNTSQSPIVPRFNGLDIDRYMRVLDNGT